MLWDHCFSSLKPVPSDCSFTVTEHGKQKDQTVLSTVISVQIQRKRGTEGADNTAFLEFPEAIQFNAISSKDTTGSQKR